MNFYLTTFRLLKSSGIRISKAYLRERLEAHPAYPSLISLTDVLDELKVKNYAFEIADKKRWTEIDFPFLAHIQSSELGEDFQLIRSKRDIGNEEDFFTAWTGVVLALEDPEKIIEHEEHSYYYRNERLNKRLGYLLVGLLTVAFSVHQLLHSDFTLVVHALLSTMGLIISILIISYSLGVHTTLTDAFCNVKEEGCNKVLSSRLGRFAGELGLADVAAIYFAGLWLFQFFSSLFSVKEIMLFLLVPSFLSLLFTLLSLIYQFWIKSWCKMCLMLTGVIWVQAILLTLSLPVSFPLPPWGDYHVIPATNYLAFFISFLIPSSWILLKPMVRSHILVKEYQLRVRKWRQNPAWFDALLPLHKRVDDVPWAHEIAYGDPEGALQILVVSDPYCPSCADAHQQLEEILEKHDEDIGVKIRFALMDFDPASKKQEAVEQIARTYEHTIWDAGQAKDKASSRKLITDWFEHQDLNKWLSQYPEREKSPLTDEWIHNSVKWSSQMNITQTPSFFINGYEMPEPHTFKDLFSFLPYYIEILNTRKKQAEPFIRN